MKKIMLAASLLALSATVAQAQEFAGGYVGVTYSGLIGSNSDIDKISLQGGGELAMSREFSLQFDITDTSFGATDLDGNSISLHGIFHASPATSLGFFIGRDEIGYDDADISATFIGAEIGHQSGTLGGEAFALHMKGETIWGLSGFVDLQNNVKLGARFDTVSLSNASEGIYVDGDITALTASYRATPSFDLSAELGRAKLSEKSLGSVSDTYLAITAKYVFGNGRGTTFKSRSALNMLPGL